MSQSYGKVGTRVGLETKSSHRALPEHDTLPYSESTCQPALLVLPPRLVLVLAPSPFSPFF